MKLTKTKSIILGIVSVCVIFSIVFILDKPTDVEGIKNVEHTLNGLPEDIVEYIDSNRIKSDLSTEEMEKSLKNICTSIIPVGKMG